MMTSTQMNMFPNDVDKNQHGSVWLFRKGSEWIARNHHGLLQVKEGTGDRWKFVVTSFSYSGHICNLMCVDERELKEVPIDDQGKMTVFGKSYTRRDWRH